jgi:hypothetical protein
VNAGDAEAIDLQRMFASQGADRLKLTSALRMNASFPYITPVVTLPSEPAMRVMDAGVRDNYGYRVTLAFLHAHREWIAANTSGVVMIQLRDTPRRTEVEPTSASLLSRLFAPVGSVYENFLHAQDQDMDLFLKQASAWAGFPLEVVDVELQRGDQERIALSWHLSALERQRVMRSVNSPANQRAFLRLKELLPTPAAQPILAGGSGPIPGGGRVMHP